MVENGIILLSIGCEPTVTPYKDFFSAIAFKTGGQYIPLRNAKLLSKVIVSGTVEEISLENIMQDVQLEVKELQQNGIFDENELTKLVEEKLHLKSKSQVQNRSNIFIKY